MGSDPRVDLRRELIDLPVLCEFKLYSTRTRYYLIGRNENKTFGRILKIDRTDPYELNLIEDPRVYTNEEIRELKRGLRHGNQKYGGLVAETTCYGIIGFVKFLGPYYMLVIKEREKVGEICGHSIYGIAESAIIMIPYPSDYTEKLSKSREERRYKKLLGMVDLSKDFYFSYTYHLMYSLQKNVLNSKRGEYHDNTMFVWNAHLTREIRRILNNTIWTVALVHGFFQQTKCCTYGEEFFLTVIARRSRHYAGTRYLRRGVNDKGRVANEVETEQIVSKEVPEGHKIPITSVVQIRGSIPLYWSQETSMFNPQPDIILSNRDATVATQNHFEHLRQRYGKRIMILNLLKIGREEHRETILQAEFANAIRAINQSAEKDDGLYATHLDLSNKYSKSGARGAFIHLCDQAKKSLALTGFFFSESPLGVGAKRVINESYTISNSFRNQDEETSSPNKEILESDTYKRQNGVLRTNCVDCLDRTNFAQYAHGMIALSRQLQILGITGFTIDTDNCLAKEMMETYQNMGDTLAKQYGGSDAHIKMFSALRGGWHMMAKQRDLVTAVVRFINNTYLDKDKQNAINLFLGHFQPQLGRPALWELDSDQHTIARISSDLEIKNIRPRRRRSFSDLLEEGDMNMEEPVLENDQSVREGLNEGASKTNSNFIESAYLSISSVINTIVSKMFPGKQECKPKFTPAKDLFEHSSSKSWSTDDIFSDLDDPITSLANMNSEDISSPTGFSSHFTWWVSCGRTL